MNLEEVGIFLFWQEDCGLFSDGITQCACKWALRIMSLSQVWLTLLAIN